MSADVVTQFPPLVYQTDLSRIKQYNLGRKTLTRGRIMKFIIAYKIANDGNSPTSRQIADATGCASTSVVHFHLRALEHQNKIKVIRHSSRQIEVIGGRWIPPKE